MYLAAADNQFQFGFPKTFMPKSVSEKYYEYINRIPGNPIKDVLGFFNSTIQSINLPGMGYDAVEQKQRARNIQFRSTIPTQELFQKELTVTFQLVNGYANYWIAMDILNYWYSFDTKPPFIDDLNVRMLDSEGNSLVTARIIRPIIKNIGDLSMSFSTNVAEFNTFDLTLGYNELEILIELD